MTWLMLFQAAIQTLAAASPSIVSLFHGGAGNTASKIGSAVQVVAAYSRGVADQLDPAQLHPDLVAHAATLTPSVNVPTHNDLAPLYGASDGAQSSAAARP